MGRGPSVKSIRKKAEAEAFGRALGELKAQKKLDKGESKDIESYFQSLREHIGKALDRVDPLYLVVGVIGMKFEENLGVKFPNTLHGAAFGMVSLRLAESPSDVASMAGVAGLAVIGLGSSNLVTDWVRGMQDAINETARIGQAPENEKPHYDQWVMAQITGSIAPNELYCEWFTRMYPNDAAPVVCGGEKTRLG